MLRKRQKFILEAAVEEYIREAVPVGSEILAQKYKFGLSSATIRNELKELAELGYLFQLHTSSGRVPTDKGYRFFVNEKVGKTFLSREKEILEGFFEKTTSETLSDIFKFNRELMRILSELTLDVAVSAFLAEKSVFQEGILNLFQKPDFKEIEDFQEIFQIMEDFDNKVEDIFSEIKEDKPRVFIGRENPFFENKNCSMIISRYNFFDEDSGVLAILGPKRMDYPKNINLLNYTSQSIKNLCFLEKKKK